ncbi:hypothetical protein DP113_25725 [Brasilonema octagenarum UFV-E1]|uniref:Uncharacterized protein n=2 Tax=Brasilonema TaxID=383614 RepID=A0A856MNN2_9CYAN|nr:MULTISPECIES: hypothetical protein [Brasilonema]NMF65427.1 hypothetical protein [Brasilonema octagenarum UFV-OR1]QDL10867.1 hypothetical protein DP114_25815 [Brasilonema sennae CENA114]QDL17212.1 hypothetical protein DP113_25725 [Brasilonema octagenarum UFV-E1]
MLFLFRLFVGAVCGASVEFMVMAVFGAGVAGIVVVIVVIMALGLVLTEFMVEKDLFTKHHPNLKTSITIAF